MNRIKTSALLLGATLITSACKTASQPQPPQTRSSYQRSTGDEDYNRAYRIESQHHHHHAKRDPASSDIWTSYDRAESADEPHNVGSEPAYLRRPYDYGSASGNSLPALRSGPHHASRILAAPPGTFDLYLLNLSWSPEFCHGHPTAAECGQRRTFTLHGLWPENRDGTYPEDCSEAPGPADPSEYADIYPDASLLQHEWQTHGTCSGLGADQFFALARRAEQSISIPAELSELTRPTMLAPAQIITLFSQANPTIPANSLALTCGNNYLTAVEVCLDRNLKPESCVALKTCKASQIRIAVPQ